MATFSVHFTYELVFNNPQLVTQLFVLLLSGKVPLTRFHLLASLAINFQELLILFTYCCNRIRDIDVR